MAIFDLGARDTDARSLLIEEQRLVAEDVAEQNREIALFPRLTGEQLLPNKGAGMISI